MELRTAAYVFSLVGAVAIAIAWLFVRAGRGSVWGAMATVVGLLGVISLGSERVQIVGAREPGTVALVGLAAGLVLYAGTWIFMRIGSRWPALVEHTDDLYAQREGVTVPRALTIAALIVVPSEELFWRGMVQGVLASTLGPLGGALAAWVAYIATNAVSMSLPIVLGVAVGGALWGALTVWAGGILGALVCHAVWTGLMIVRRPG